MKDFWKNLAEKWPIVALAPMDWYTDSAYRQVVKTVNKDVMCFTEFYSADWLVHSKFLADAVLPHKDIEKPLIVQIFWKDPEMFARAAKIIERYNVAWIDINMGCPAKKVVRSWHWSCLIITPDTAFKIVETLNKATHLPISVKTRLGWNGSESLINFWKWLENAWASLLTVHWRTTAQAYTWNADFTQIYELKKELSIPVICNWDIVNIADWINKLQNLDWFMIWRHSFWNPWCFDVNWYTPNLGEILDMMEKHATWLVECKSERKWTLDIRKHLVQYLKWFPWVSKYRKRLVTIESLQMLFDITNEIRNEFSDSLELKPAQIHDDAFKWYTWI